METLTRYNHFFLSEGGQWLRKRDIAASSSHCDSYYNGSDAREWPVLQCVSQLISVGTPTIVSTQMFFHITVTQGEACLRVYLNVIMWYWKRYTEIKKIEIRTLQECLNQYSHSKRNIFRKCNTTLSFLKEVKNKLHG